MKIIIAGGRDFQDYELLCRCCDYYFSQQAQVEIISGGAQGADALGERYAKERGYTLLVKEADWDNVTAPGAVVRQTKKGKAYNAVAGHWRNQEMADIAQGLVLFWDGKSSGSRDMLSRARKKGLKIKIVYY